MLLRATVTGDKTVRYGRTVAKVSVAGVDCNRRQIELGMAWHYKQYAGKQPSAERAAYAAAEDAARAAKRGLWADPHAMPPWDWRNGDGPGTQKGEQAWAHNAGECDCDSGGVFAGKRGGQHCLTASGARSYFKQRRRSPCREKVPDVGNDRCR